jgi:coiled-coil domain-containing protein 63/114
MPFSILILIQFVLISHSQLKILSGEKETDKIISEFIKEEEENYALFNYVNELSHEIEQLNETVQQLQDSIGNLI